MSITVGLGCPQDAFTKFAVTLEPHDILPSPASEKIENRGSRIPAITQVIRGLQPTTARLTLHLAFSVSHNLLSNETFGAFVRFTLPMFLEGSSQTGRQIRKSCSGTIGVGE